MLANLTRSRRTEERLGGLSMADYAHMWEQFSFNGVGYMVPGGNLDELKALQAQRNPVVWACISVRLMVFSEIRFAYQQWQSGRPGTLFGTPDLTILEQPWPQATTGDLLARMELDASLYGNSYWTRPGNGDQLVRLDPTKVSIATADAIDPATGNAYGKRLVGYFLKDTRGQIASTFLPDEVCHYKPVPDPDHEFRGATWLNALLPDITADSDLTDYKHAFLRNAATPNLVVNFKDKVSEEAFNLFKDKMEAGHTGTSSGFKTLYLGSGVDVKVVGSNFNDLALAAVQSAGETRIAAAAGVPSGIVGLSEGLKGSSLNAGNYAATRRRFSDGTMRPLWRSAVGALSTLVPAMRGARLWYDERDVMFLQEDVLDTSTIRQADATTILTYIQAGFDPDSATAAVSTGDTSKLVHTGLISVQLQPPVAPVPADSTPPVIEPPAAPNTSEATP